MDEETDTERNLPEVPCKWPGEDDSSLLSLSPDTFDSYLVWHLVHSAFVVWLAKVSILIAPQNQNQLGVYQDSDWLEFWEEERVHDLDKLWWAKQGVVAIISMCTATLCSRYHSSHL